MRQHVSAHEQREDNTQYNTPQIMLTLPSNARGLIPGDKVKILNSLRSSNPSRLCEPLRDLEAGGSRNMYLDGQRTEHEFLSVRPCWSEAFHTDNGHIAEDNVQYFVRVKKSVVMQVQ